MRQNKGSSSCCLENNFACTRVNCDRCVLMCVSSSYMQPWFLSRSRTGLYKDPSDLTLGPNSPLPSLSQTSAEISVWPMALILGCALRVEQSVQTHSYSNLSARKANLSGCSKWCVFLNSCLIGQTVCQYLGFFSPPHGTCPCFFLLFWIEVGSSAGRVRNAAVLRTNLSHVELNNQKEHTHQNSFEK